MPAPSRRVPWPCDIRIAGTGLMLGRPGKNEPQAPLISINAQPYQDQTKPEDESQTSLPPLVEYVHAWNDLSLGMGLQLQGATQSDKKVRNCLGADTSVGGFIMKGPLITTFTPAITDSTNGIQDFYEMGGVLYAMNGGNVLQRNNDTTWPRAAFFAAGVHILHGCTFTSGGGTPAQAVFLAMNGANKALWSTDNATFNTFATFTCLDFVTVGRQLYRASDTNQLSSVDENADPTVEANWTNANSYRTGDKTAAIQRLAVTAVGSLLVFKADGIYSIDESGNDHRLFPYMGFGVDADDGTYWFTFGNDLHVTYGKQHVRLVPTVSFGNPRLALQPIGPERLIENKTEVTGRITAGVANGSLGAYAGLYNDDTGDSYLLKFSSWIGASLAEGKLEEAQRIDAWHGSISQKFASKKITAMFKSNIGAPAGHQRAYIGFSDGTLAWFVMPCKPNPAACSQYLFDNVTDGVVNFPLFHGGHAADYKALRGFSVAGTTLTSNEYAMWNYKLDQSNSAYTAFQDSTGAQIKFDTTPLKRADFGGQSTSGAAKSALADIQLVLHNTNTSTSPIVTTAALHYALIPAKVLDYKGIVLADSGLVKRNGSLLRIGAEKIRDVVQTAAIIGAGGTSVDLPDETTRSLMFLSYGEQMAWSDVHRKWFAGLTFEAVEYQVNAVTGLLIATGTIQRTGPYLLGDLWPYSLSDLGSL